VLAVDKHQYYKRVSGQGLKCVDFLALDEQFGLVMIELKNYNGHPIPSDLREIFAAKVKDTKQLIRVINKYLGRQWYYKLLFKKLKWHRICPSEWKYWEKCEQLINDGKVICLLDTQL